MRRNDTLRGNVASFHALGGASYFARAGLHDPPGAGRNFRMSESGTRPPPGPRGYLYITSITGRLRDPLSIMMPFFLLLHTFVVPFTIYTILALSYKWLL